MKNWFFLSTPITQTPSDVNTFCLLSEYKLHGFYCKSLKMGSFDCYDYGEGTCTVYINVLANIYFRVWIKAGCVLF